MSLLMSKYSYHESRSTKPDQLPTLTTRLQAWPPTGAPPLTKCPVMAGGDERVRGQAGGWCLQTSATAAALSHNTYCHFQVTSHHVAWSVAVNASL